jgi:hypothetical protein
LCFTRFVISGPSKDLVQNRSKFVEISTALDSKRVEVEDVT